MSQQRHLAAILFTDIVGYTALMQENEQMAVALIKHYNASLNRIVALHEGKVLNYYGDGSLCTFPSATEALNCAIELQKELQADPHVPLRVGLHIGEVLFEDGKALGDGVNVASRIQSLGQANTILFSKEIFDKIRNHPEFKPVSLGLFDFKNVDEPVEVFALANEGLVVPKREQMSGKLKRDLSKKKYATRRNLIAGASAMILLIVAIMLFAKYFNHQNNAIEKSIAVLPFVNMSNDTQQDYFADGMMDEILNHLYKIGGLKVTSRTSSLTYKGSKKTSTEIANELGVGNLLEGSVQKDGDHIRIIAQLINGRTDDHLWAETYVRDFKDIFSIQSDIAQQIASNLKIKIDPGVKKRIENIPTKNTEAYDLYLRARDKLLNYDLEEGKKLLQLSIKLDPNFAPAYADMAYYWINMGSFVHNLTSKEAKDSAIPLLNKAIQLDENLASAYEYFALVHLWFEWDFRNAGKAWKKAVELNPSGLNGLNGYQDYVDFLSASGKFDEAIDIGKSGLKDKNNLRSWAVLAKAYYVKGDFEKASEIYEAFSKIFNSDLLKFNSAINKCFLKGYKEAILDLEQFNKSYPYFDSFPFALGCQAIVLYKTGNLNMAGKVIQEMKLKANNNSAGSPSFYIAAVYSVMGNKNQSLYWLEKAYTNHEVEIYWLNVEPLFNPLRNDPRFKELLTKIDLK
jgi:adenylate cyclase